MLAPGSLRRPDLAEQKDRVRVKWEGMLPPSRHPDLVADKGDGEGDCALCPAVSGGCTGGQRLGMDTADKQRGIRDARIEV